MASKTIDGTAELPLKLPIDALRLELRDPAEDRVKQIRELRSRAGHARAVPTSTSQHER